MSPSQGGQNCVASAGSGGANVTCLFWLLQAAPIPWLIAPSPLQTLSDSDTSASSHEDLCA